MRKLFGFLLAGLIVAGCHAQVPPATTHVVNLSWQAPVASGTWGGCTTSAPCVYAVYRCTASAATCANTGSSSWSEITTSTTRPSGTSYTDPSAAGLTAYYTVETVQGSQNSAPSNTTSVTVPASPIAPSLGQPTAAQLEPGPLPRPAPELASIPAVSLRASIGSR